MINFNLEYFLINENFIKSKYLKKIKINLLNINLFFI